MTEKTRKQIEAMKQQTIGVEIEMAKITREKACRTVAKFFGTEHTVYRNGSRWYCTDTQNRKWTVAYDGSIEGDGAELITPILTYADIEDLQKITRLLRKAGAKSNPNLGCGVHIHIGANGHTPQSLRNLANIMASHEHLLARAINIAESRINHYCKAVNPTFLGNVNNLSFIVLMVFNRIVFFLTFKGTTGSDRNNSISYSKIDILKQFLLFSVGIGN